MSQTKLLKIHKIRKFNLRLLIDKHGATELAAMLGHSNGSYLSQIAGPNPIRPISERLARKIEGIMRLPEGWMDVERSVFEIGITNPTTPTGALALRAEQKRAAHSAGVNEEPLELEMPAFLRREAAAPVAPAKVDVELLTQCVADAFTRFGATGSIPAPAKFAELVNIAYTSGLRGQPLTDFIGRLASLAA